MEASDCGKDGTKGFPGSARRLLGSQVNPFVLCRYRTCCTVSSFAALVCAAPAVWLAA